MEVVYETDTTPAPKAANSTGGKGAKGRRKHNRAAKNKQPKADAITSQTENRLRLKNTPDLLALTPAYALRPTAVHVDLQASNLAIIDMLARMRQIAQRPLALLLGDVENVLFYRKVCAYLMFARVCASQLSTSYAAGVELPLANAIDAYQLRFIDAQCRLIPNFFAWMLSHIGHFDRDSHRVVPSIPHPGDQAVTIHDAMRGNYFSLCTYIRRHRVGQDGINIPAADGEFIPALVAAFPVTTANHRFTDISATLFDPEVTADQWNAFTNINGALTEQNCCVRDFKLSEAVGTEISRVRFRQRVRNHEEVNYYCADNINGLTIRHAMILRLGMDVDLPESMQSSRFIMNYQQAPLSGLDVPAPYVNAQLMLT